MGSVQSYLEGLQARAKAFGLARDNAHDAAHEDYEARSWEHLMDELLALTDNYQPGTVMAPGSGSTGDDPAGINYVDLGKVAFVLNEGLDAAVTRGVDRDGIIAAVAHSAQCDPQEVEDALSGKEKCPTQLLMQAWADALAIDAGVVFDAAIKDGCKFNGYEPPGPPGE